LVQEQGDSVEHRVQGFPLNSEYHQKSRRNDVWHELSLRVKKPMTTFECKRKMDTILSSFRERIKLRKMSEMAVGDSNSPRGSTWFLYNSLTFLNEKDFFRANKSVVSISRPSHE
ncbi:unnamed protein product, partial [Heterotrigona itama]